MTLWLPLPAAGGQSYIKLIMYGNQGCRAVSWSTFLYITPEIHVQNIHVFPFLLLYDSGLEFVRAWFHTCSFCMTIRGVFLKQTVNALWMIPEVYETHEDSISTINLIWFDCCTVMSDINVVPADNWGVLVLPGIFGDCGLFPGINYWGVLGFLGNLYEMGGGLIKGPQTCMVWRGQKITLSESPPIPTKNYPPLKNVF